MTKEQEKAIERLDKRIKDNEDYKTTQVWLTDDVSAVYTVLNIIKEKDKEIEYQKDINKTEKERHKQTEKSLKGQIIKKDEIIEKLEKEAQGYFETTIIQSEQFSKELKEKDKEIEKLEQALARNIARNVTSSMKESAKSKEDLEMLNAGWQIELEKKDKIIDLMAGYIATLDIEEDICKKTGKDLNKCDCMALGECENCIKQYFKSKAEKE